MHTVSTIEARSRNDASFASEAQAMAHIEEFITCVAGHGKWEVRYDGPDRGFVFTSSEWEALEAERLQEIKNDDTWNDRVRFWHGGRRSKEMDKKKKEQDGQTTLDSDDDNDEEGPDWI